MAKDRNRLLTRDQRQIIHDQTFRAIALGMDAQAAAEMIYLPEAVRKDKEIYGQVETRAGSRRSRRQSARRSAKPRRRSAARSNTRPPSEEFRPPSNAAVTFLRQTAGRSKGR